MQTCFYDCVDFPPSCWRDGEDREVVTSTDGQQAGPVPHAGHGGEVPTTTSLLCRKWRDVQATEGC